MHISSEPGEGNHRTIILAIVAFAICSTVASLTSRGFIDADGAMHYMMARHVFEEPAYLTDVWGRPLATGLFALPARLFGLAGVRATSLLIAIGTALIAWRLAVGQKMRWPILALIFTFGQPLFFLHSFAELTELPFALVIGAALLAYQNGKFGWMTLFVAISPLGRPEGFGFLILAAIGLVIHRKWQWIPLLIVPLALWSYLGHMLAGPPDIPWWNWLPAHWPYESGSEYARGPIYLYFVQLPVIVGPFALPALCLGLARTSIFPGSDSISRARWLTAVLPVGILIIHSLLHHFGKLSSAGKIRYMLIAAPMWGVLTARGWEWVFENQRWREPLAWAGVAAVATGMVNFGYRVLPIVPGPSWDAARDFVAYYQSNAALRQNYPRLLTNHPGIFFYMDISPVDHRIVEPWARSSAEHPLPGMILVWDRVFSAFNADAKYVVPLDVVTPAGWIENAKLEVKSNCTGQQMADDPWHIYLSPLDSKLNSTQR